MMRFAQPVSRYDSGDEYCETVNKRQKISYSVPVPSIRAVMRQPQVPEWINNGPSGQNNNIRGKDYKEWAHHIAFRHCDSNVGLRGVHNLVDAECFAKQGSKGNTESLGT